MRFGIEIVPFGEYSDPRRVVELARAAEDSGWEGLWIWDHVLFPYGAGDPWIALAAVAAVTQRLKLITGVAPVPRYRPHLLARMLAGLDRLSQGRVIFGAGLGIDPDFEPFGETGGARRRGEMTDEGLDLLARLLSGEAVDHAGRYYTAKGVALAPVPVQKPRLPVWIGGDSPAALRRAARWDGWILGVVDENKQVTTPPEKIAAHAAAIRSHRETGGPFEVAVDGVSEPGAPNLAGEYRDAGATWWFEILFPLRGSHEEMLRRVKAGPPEAAAAQAKAAPPAGAVRIRAAQPEDAALLAELGRRTFAETFAADNTPENMAAYLAAAFSPEKQAAELAEPGSTFLVAEAGGEAVGYARLVAGPAPEAIAGRRPLEIRRIYARQDWIGRGVGSALMQAALDWAQAAGCDTVWLDVWERNPRAIAFYARWGFQVAGRQAFPLGDDLQNDLLMQRAAR